jgi:hypothetical protein
MKNIYFSIRPVVLILFLQACSFTTLAQKNAPNHVWIFTYLKAIENQKANLQTYIEKNWFVMDSIAVKQKLIGQYELYENKAPENKDWDFIVAVEYLTPTGYEAVSTEFEAIRAKHQVVKVDGLGFKELGKVVKSETISRKQYLK